MSTSVTARPHPLTVDDYHRMGDEGILHHDDRIELVEGEIVRMPPIGPAHAGKVSRLSQLFTRLLGDRAIVWAQNPILLPPHNEPQPDIAILLSRPDFYESALPVAGDILLLIEVSDTSLAFDRDKKQPVYARFGIPEFWIVDVNAKRVTIFREPSPTGYRNIEIARADADLVPTMIPDIAVRPLELW